jgi:ribonucleoside-diphosphate reductase alpha chain
MISENAQKVLEERYFVRNDKREIIENWEGMTWRVASALAAIEASHGFSPEQVKATAYGFQQDMFNLDFLPNSPALANAGTRTGQLAACFVFPVPDDLADIFNSVRDAVLTHQTGGGTGFSFSRLRPKMDIVQSTKGFSSGPVSFMEAFNQATEVIKQGGMRRGANMGILRVDHPDVIDFIECKNDTTKLTNFNISIAMTEAFMKAVKAGTKYDLVNPRNGEVVLQLDARDVMRKLATGAWLTGEPGIVFLDRMNEYNPVPWLGKYEATNPCGEQPLLPYESCNLGSINLENFVTQRDNDDDAGSFTYVIDWDRLRDVIRRSTHALDNVVDANRYVDGVPKIAETAKATRKTGLGVMGFARMLFKLGVAYGSEESFKVAEQVMSFIDYNSKLMSVELSKSRGQFPARSGHVQESNQFFKTICFERHFQKNKHPECDYLGLYDLIEMYGIRNSNTTTNAPTGTLSIIANTSGGIEPVFALAFKRFQAGLHMLDADQVFGQVVKEVWSDPRARKQVLEGVDKYHGSIIEYTASVENTVLKKRLEKVAEVFVTAHDLPPMLHVQMQARFQRYNDSAISKTINFGENATIEDIEAAYLASYDEGCKGITVYRNKSRQFQPLALKEDGKTNEGKDAQAKNESEANDEAEAKPACPNCGSPNYNPCEPCENCGHVGACSL